MNSRIKIAVEFLKEGKSFSVGNIRLSIDESGGIEVAGWSQFINLESITKATSIRELEEIKTLFKEMIEESAELSTFIQGKSVLYSLYFDDYGKASIIICSENYEGIKWYLKVLL